MQFLRKVPPIARAVAGSIGTQKCRNVKLYIGTGATVSGISFAAIGIKPAEDSNNSRFSEAFRKIFLNVNAKKKVDADVEGPPTAKGKAQLTAAGCMKGSNTSGGGCVATGQTSYQKCGPCCNSQCNITAPPTMYSLFLWINLDPTANPKAVAKIAADMECLVDSVTSPCDDPCESMIAGVGFGPNFFNQVMGKTARNYYYTHRKGLNGELPAVGGDVFLHAKCNNLGKLFDLCKHYIISFPSGSIAEFEDIYGFDFRNGRDLSGFYDCRTNRADEEGRQCVAIECESGGSYALAQKWIHNFCVVRPENHGVLEKYIGRDMECGNELKSKSITSHVARMVGSTEMGAPPTYEIVRHSQNFGTMSTEAGQFFLAFARDCSAFEFMLDNMVGSGADNACDDVMKMSQNVKGAYWYFPAIHELCALVQSNPY